jgi:glycosyltransferase involved in cell wall biosynthesis
MDKANILIVTELFPNQQNSFLGTFVVDQLRQLKNNYNIFIIVPYSISIFQRPKSKPLAQTDFEGIQVFYIKYIPLWIIALSFLKLIKKDNYYHYLKKTVSKKIIGLAEELDAKNKFSLVHGHEVFIGDEAANVGKSLKIPSIITVHSLFEYHLSLFGKKIMPMILNNLGLADKLITVSKLVEKTYLNHGLKKNMTIVPNGLKPKPPAPLPDYWKNIILNKKVILAVGFFSKEKRFDQLIKVCSKLKQTLNDKFVVLIVGSGDLKKYYLSLISKLQLNNQVFIVGQVPPQEITAYFDSCDFLVHPSVIESFSMVCLEAMSRHKTFICTENIGITEYVQNGKEAIIIKSDNDQQLLEKMQLLLENGSLSQKMGEAAYQTSLNFQWEILIPRIINIYNQLIHP